MLVRNAKVTGELTLPFIVMERGISCKAQTDNSPHINSAQAAIFPSPAFNKPTGAQASRLP